MPRRSKFPLPAPDEPHAVRTWQLGQFLQAARLRKGLDHNDLIPLVNQRLEAKGHKPRKRWTIGRLESGNYTTLDMVLLEEVCAVLDVDVADALRKFTDWTIRGATATATLPAEAADQLLCR